MITGLLGGFPVVEEIEQFARDGPPRYEVAGGKIGNPQGAIVPIDQQAASPSQLEPAAPNHHVVA